MTADELLGRAGLRSVRARTAAAATLVVAIALGAASLGLVAAVERGLVHRLRAANANRLESAAGLLREGATPQEVTRTLVAAPPDQLVQVLDGQGNVLAASPGFVDAAGLAFAAGSAAPLVTTPEGDVLVDQLLVTGGAPGYEVAGEQVLGPAGKVFTVVAAAPLAEVERALDTLSGVLRVGVPLLVVAVAVVSWALVGRALRPIEVIRAEVDEISHSTMHRRVPEPATGDEVERLARTMNGMLDRLERSAERQRRFVSDASHELRSPVATIRTELEVAALHPGRADWPAVARGVLSDAGRLEEILADLLELARLDEGTAAPDGVRVDLGELAREEAGRPRAVAVDTTGVGAATVVGDPARLRAVLRNLLDNAARHARGSVAVEVREDGGGVLLAVEDDGPGVPAPDRERVFERFTRLDEGRSRGGGGVGLGLAMVRSIAEQHGGRVRVGDGSRGGARFEVRLPVGEPAPPVGAAAR